MIPVYCVSGLGADERIFSDLDIGEGYEIIPVKHVDHRGCETLKEYALLLAQKIPIDREVVLLGDSFGGMVVQEIAQVRKVKFLILTSTIKQGDNLD